MFSAAIDRLRSLFARERAISDGLPGNCFISHKYQDRENLASLLGGLPEHVSPLVFPPIDVTPEQRVSDDLVKAILDCAGLIYIDSKLTLSSVWCSFERDYAKRALKKVFRFDIRRCCFLTDRAPAKALKVFVAYSSRDRETVRSICEFLKERHFDVFGQVENFGPGIDYQNELSLGRKEIRNDGYTIAFFSPDALRTEWFNKEIKIALRDYPERILPVIIAPLHFADRWDISADIDFADIGPEFIFDIKGEEAASAPYYPRAYYKASKDFAALGMDFRLKPSVVFKRGGGIFWNRVDDLIVRIYNMAHRAEGWHD